MARELKQSTAANAMVFMTDSSDHITGKPGLTLTITASKNGAAFGSITPTVTERGNGWYNVAYTTSHTDTLGDFAVHFTGTGADPTDVLYEVRANILGDTLPSNVLQWNSSNVPAPNVAGVPKVDLTQVGGVAPSLPSTVDSNLVNVKGTALTETTAGRLAGNLSTLLDNGNAASSLTLSSVSTFNTTSQTVTLKSGTHTGAVIPTVTAVTNAVNANTTQILGNNITESTAGRIAGNYSTFWDNADAATTSVVDDVGTGGGGATAAAIWDYLTASISTAGSIGKLLKDNIDGTISGIPAAVRDVDNTSPSAGSLGAKVNSASSAGDPWGTSLPGNYGPGTAGYIIAYGTQTIHLNPGTPSPSVRRRP